MNNSNPQKDQHWQMLVLLLKRIALQKGITQQQIAQKTGLQPNNVSRLFSLRYCPRLEIFLKVAQALGVNFFFEDQESDTNFNKAFEEVMAELGRRPDKMTNLN